MLSPKINMKLSESSPNPTPERNPRQRLTPESGRHALAPCALPAPGEAAGSTAWRTGSAARSLDDGEVQVNELGLTTVPGVYAAGDLCRAPATPTAGPPSQRP